MNKLPKINIEGLPAGRQGKPKYTKFAQDLDFYALFQKIEASHDTCFIFESLGEEGKFARYSILGFDPKHIISARGKVLTMDKKEYTVDNPYLSLKEIMPADVIAKNFCGGLVGYIGYDAVNYLEPAVRVKPNPDFDQLLFGVYTDGLVLDKLTNELFYFYYDVDRSAELHQIARSELPERALQVEFSGDTMTREEHEAIVEDVREKIKAGNIFQCEVGFKSKFRVKGDTLKVYSELRKVNPSPFMYYLKFNSQKIIGASPELCFSLREGEMTTRPLAGTIRRGKDDTEDQQLARALLNDEKEIAEHNMLVDLHRNDIGKVSSFGSVRIRDLMTVAKFSHVQHISSEICGLISEKDDMFTSFASNFPAGTLTGAPKIEAMKIIEENEPEGRGPYGGAVGHFGFNGECTFAIAIRSLFISQENAYIQTASGIVYDSVAEKEYDEIKRKLQAMKTVLKKFEK